MSLHRAADGTAELAVRDDGHGFGDGEQPFPVDDPGHIGLATMRERTEVAGGTFRIETGATGTAVIARVPMTVRATAPR